MSGYLTIPNIMLPRCPCASPARSDVLYVPKYVANGRPACVQTPVWGQKPDIFNVLHASKPARNMSCPGDGTDLKCATLHFM
jgi:hypothetical protein